MKRTISLSLVALLLALSLASCSGDSSTTDISKTADTTSSGADTTVETTESRAVPDLPETDFDGATVTTLTWETVYSNIMNDFWATEQTGEPLNDAVYARNEYVAEKYNFSLEHVTSQRANFRSAANTAILANEDIYSILNGSIDDANYFAQNGYLYDLNSLDFIDLDKEWWDQRANEHLSIKGKIFYALGDINTMDNSQTWGFLFNKNVADDFGIDNLYQLVRDGEWTLDEMYSMMQTVSGDTNGDGVQDEKDRWGLLSEAYNYYMHFLGTGGLVAQKDENDIPYLSLDSERTIASLEKIHGIMNDRSTAFNAHHWSHIAAKSIFTDHFIPMFSNDQVLFWFTGIGNTYLDLREMESPFGILPTPKYDEAQDEYYNGIHLTWGTCVNIPISCADSERSAFILEALAAESVNTVTPAYFDIIYANKGVRDEESLEMVDIILDTRMYDIGYINNWGDVAGMFTNILSSSDMVFPSMYAAKESAIIAAMDKMIENYN